MGVGRFTLDHLGVRVLVLASVKTRSGVDRVDKMVGKFTLDRVALL